MKRLSIQWRVTLWFTLLMTLLAAVGLAFLFFVGGQSALAATQNRMAEMAETARSEIGLDSSGFVFDSDLEYFRDGVYLSVYDAAGLPLYGAVPRLFDNTVVFADSQLRELTDAGGRWYVYDISFAVDESQVWVRTVAAVDEVGSTITHKALVTVAEAIGLAAILTIERPETVKAAREEYVKETGGKYICPVGMDAKPELEHV